MRGSGKLLLLFQDLEQFDAALDVLAAWRYGLVLGAERFEYMTRYRKDPLLSRLLGFSRFLSSDTLRRFFGGIKYHLTTKMVKALIRISLDVMQPILLDHTLDFVSMAFCRYGEQASA